MNERVYRSTSEQMIGGVAAGLAHRMGLAPNLVRLGFVLGTFLTHGLLFFVYLALWAMLPTSASTATNVGDTVRENVNEVAARFGLHTASPAAPADPGAASTSTAAPTPSAALSNGQTIVRVLVIGGLIYALAMLGGLGAMFSGAHHMHGGGGFLFPLLLLLGLFWWLRRRA